jgi:hypothetical protein
MNEAKKSNEAKVYYSLSEFLDHFLPQPLGNPPMETHEDARDFGANMARQSFKEINVDWRHKNQ